MGMGSAFLATCVSATKPTLRLGLLAAFAIAGAVALIPPVEAAKEGVEVGTTVVTVSKVTGILRQQNRILSQGLRVHRSEVLETSADGRAEFQLDDKTKLALGPNGRLTLDEYVLGQPNSRASITVKVLKGAFRFLTGSTDSRAYRIETPAASIGIRGTVLDVFVDWTGETVILLHEGALEICSKTAPGSMTGNCRQFNLAGQILFAGCRGIIAVHPKYSEALLPGINVVTAFPFVGQSYLQIDPVARLTHPAISDEAVRAIDRARRQACG